MKTSALLEARENANDQVAIVVSFASDWLRGWCEFSGPITEQRLVKSKQSRITFDTKLKIAENLQLVFLGKSGVSFPQKTRRQGTSEKSELQKNRES